MIKKIAVVFIFTLFLVPMITSSSYGENYNYFDENGKKIEKAEYKKLLSMRKPKINGILKQGYGRRGKGFQDPVLLRKKRMRQWELYRKSHK